MDTTNPHIAQLRQRLADSRYQVFDLAHAMKGDRPENAAAVDGRSDSGFPHSRIMRALMGKSVGIALGSAAVAATVMRPALLLKALQFTPMLRPLLMRYVLPRLLGQR